MSKTDSPIEILQREYLSQIRKALPLHRIIVFIVAIAMVVQSKISSYKSLTEGLLKSSVKSFFDIDDGYFSTLIVQDGLLALAMLIFGYLLHTLLLRLAFTGMKKRLKLDNVMEKLSIKTSSASDNSVFTYLSIKRSELEASTFKNKISYLSSLSETGASLSILFAYATFYGNVVDAVISGVCLMISIYLQRKALIVFLKNYLPHNAHIQGILGTPNKIEFP